MTDSDHWKRIQDLFEELLDLDEADCERRIESVDNEVAAEVRSLLRAHRAASGFLDRTDPSGPSGPTPVGSWGTRLESAFAPGMRLGPYRLEEEIGHGGMGIVFRATRDDENFTKEVAVKLIDPGRRSDDILRRFRAERQILAMLDHPHIARLVDGGTAPDGSPYLVMDFVSGRPLLEYCDHHRLGIDQRLALFLAVCDAVQFAHQRLVVHRDLKSDNILVTDDGTPRLLDFGIARLLTPEGDTGTLTLPMQRMLTPDYASPEQVRGEPVTVAGDVYSLGVILYELLSGSRPHKFKTRSPEEILRVITQEEPVAPSAAMARSATQLAAEQRGDTTRRLRKRIAGDLDDVVLKCLEKDPARRYGTAEQLAADIRRHLAGEPVSARGHTTAYLISRFVRRHRVAVTSGSLVLVALLIGLGATMWQAREAKRERDLAERRFADVRELAHAVVFPIHDAIINLPGSTKAREILVEHALRYLDGLSRDAGADDPKLLLELGDAYGKIGDVQGRPMWPNLGQSEAALASYDRALALLDRACAAMPDSVIPINDYLVTMQRRADLLNTMGRPDEALAQSVAAGGRAREGARRHPTSVLLHKCVVVSYARLSDMYLARGDTAAALAAGDTLSVSADALVRLAPDDPDNRRSQMISAAKGADLLAHQGHRAAADSSYRVAVRLASEAAREFPDNTDAMRDLSIVYGMFGFFQSEAGDIDSALATYEKGMQIVADLAERDPDNVNNQADVALGDL
ncbi:MAG TPA: serine/threonine-protein kinase, partial [Candidatus Eisenbacteria bacterium]